MAQFSKKTSMSVLLAAFLAVPVMAAADAPSSLKSVRVARAYGWQPLGADALVVWLGVEEPYVVTLFPGCLDPRDGPEVGLTSHRRRIEVRLDAIVTSAGRCPIKSLRRADLQELEGAGLRQAEARSLSLLPEPATRQGR